MNKMIFRTVAVVTTSAALFAAASSASAAVISNFDGAAVYSDASANFQGNTTLANNYVENGLVFQYTGIGNNAGCGFEGVDCYDYPQDLSPAFAGNYFATSGSNAYVSVRRTDGSDMVGIQFAAGTGYQNLNGYWQTFNDGVRTGFGNFSRPAGAVLTLSDWQGFDELRYFAFSTANRQAGFSSAAIDQVTVDVPEPGSMALMGAGLIGLAGLRRKRKTAA